MGEPANHPAIVHVRRQYVNVQGRTILIEAVRLTKIRTHLSRLPLQSSIGRHLPVYASGQRELPKAPPTPRHAQPLKFAAISCAAPGFVLDYVEINTDMNDFTFQGDTTYYISSSPNFSGHVIIEGGTVIKYTTDPDNPACMAFWGDLVCDTSPYHPAVITSQNDNTVGENVSNPAFPLAYYWGAMAGTATPSVVWHDMKICYAQYGIDDTYLQAHDCQFVNCLYPLMADLVSGATCSVTNVLIVNAQAAFLGTDFSAVAYHLTVDNCTNLVTDYYGDSGTTLALTNCLLVNVQGNGDATVTTGFTSEYSGDSSSVFQTVGGGAHYLANSSPYRNAGTLAVDDCVLDDISLRTTWPPIVYTVPGQLFTNNLNLYPQAVRDTNSAPDLGYHYAPLDYLLGGMYLTNASITLNPGTALGIYGTNSLSQYGIAVNGQAQFVSIGAANNLNHVAAYNTVQEQTGTNWVEVSMGMVMSWFGTNAQYQCQFTDWSVMAHDSWLVWLDYYVPHGAQEAFNDCQFHGGQLETDFPTLCLTNCLFDRVYVGIYPSDANLTVIRNNLFYGGTFDFAPLMTNSMIADNLFDQTVIPDEMAGLGHWYVGGHNAYVTNFNTLDFTCLGDIILSNAPAFDAGPLGNYYLPISSPLIYAGSTTANQVGLYHYTITTNLVNGLEVPEGNNTVSIGYHYVATDQYGNPLDSNGDGIPDYLEDPTGHGLPLSITLVAPTSSTIYAEPANVGMQATIFDWSGSVTNVTFLNGSTNVGVVAAAPYNYTWPVIPYGNYTIMAEAYDNKGATAISLPASITVTNRCGD